MGIIKDSRAGMEMTDRNRFSAVAMEPMNKNKLFSKNMIEYGVVI